MTGSSVVDTKYNNSVEENDFIYLVLTPYWHSCDWNVAVISGGGHNYNYKTIHKKCTRHWNTLSSLKKEIGTKEENISIAFKNFYIDLV